MMGYVAIKGIDYGILEILIKNYLMNAVPFDQS